MYTDTIYANISVDEGTVSTSANVSIPWLTSKLIVTNDSATEDLTVKLKTSSDGITLKPEETLTVKYRTRKLALLGSNVPFRVWAFG